MEVHNELLIEILTTLEKIERMNKAIEFHSEMEDPDLSAITQYQSVKNDLSKQLTGLLVRFGVKLELAA